MSPTCTIPYEVLFEFVNNTGLAATVQVCREDGSGTGATILLHRGESISLVLTAGTSYKYAVKQSEKEASLGVKVWQDTQCSLLEVLSIPPSRNDFPLSVIEGVTVTPSPRTQAPRTFT